MDNRKTAVVLLAFLVLLPAATALSIPFIDIGGGGDTTDTETDNDETDSSSNDFVPYINQEVRGTGIPAVTVRGYVAAETTNYSAYSCYMAESDNKMILQESTARGNFENVGINSVGRVNFRVDAPESEVGSTYNVVTQCFGPDEEPTNIIKIEFTTEDNFPDAEYAYGAGISDKSVTYYGPDGEAKSLLDQYGPTAEKTDSYRSRYSMENVRVSSCTVEPRNLEKGEEYSVSITVTNNNNYAIPVSFDTDIDSSNLNKLGYETFDIGFGVSDGETVEAGSTTTLSDSSDLDFGGFADAFTDERKYDIEDVMGSESHEIRASVKVSRPGSDSSCSVSCGFVAIDQSPSGQTNMSQTCSGAQTGTSGGSGSGGGGFYSGSPDYNQLELENRKILVNRTQTIYVGLNSSQSEASVMVISPEGDRKIYAMDNGSATLSYSETVEPGEYEVFLGEKDSFEETAQTGNTDETEDSGTDNGGAVNRALRGVERGYLRAIRYMNGLTGRAIAMPTAGGGGGTTDDTGDDTTTDETDDSGDTDNSDSSSSQTDTGSDQDSETSDRNIDYWDRAVFEVIRYPAWKQYCDANINDYSPDPEAYSQVSCLGEVRDACFRSNPAEGCQGVQQSVCELNDMDYRSSENACGPEE